MITDNELTKWLEKRETQEWLLYRCKLFSRGAEDAKELNSEVLFRLWNCRENYTGDNNEDSIRKWVFGIIKYTYVQVLELKYKKPSYKIEEFSRESLERLFNDKSSFLTSLQTQSVINSVIDEVSINLSKKHSKVLIMSTDGYSSKEIAKELELTPGTVDRYKVENKKYIKTNITNTEEIIIATKNDEKREFDSLKQAIIELNLGKSYAYQVLNTNNTTEGWKLKTTQRKLESV